MILDTLAAISSNDFKKICKEKLSIQAVTEKLINLEKNDIIHFEYEIINVRGKETVNIEIEKWKSLILNIISDGSGFNDEKFVEEIIKNIILYKKNIFNKAKKDENLQKITCNDKRKAETVTEPTCNEIKYHFSSIVEDESLLLPKTINKKIPCSFETEIAFSSIREYNNDHSDIAKCCRIAKDIHCLDKDYNLKSRFKNEHISEKWIEYIAEKQNVHPLNIKYALDIMKNTGVPNEEKWEDGILIKGSPGNWGHLISRWKKIDSYYQLKNIDEIKYSIYNYKMVIANIEEDDVYKKNVPIVIIGYNDDKKCLKFICPSNKIREMSYNCQNIKEAWAISDFYDHFKPFSNF